MLSILVCHSYFLRLDQKQLQRAKPYPPLATLQVAAMLRNSGHRISLFDAMLADGTGDYEKILALRAPQLVLFYEDNFNFLAKMCLGVMRRAACDMIAAARRSTARVIVAGPDVSDAPAPYLRAGADIALVGEGLTALFEILPGLEAQPSASVSALVDGVPGTATLVDGEIVTTRGGRVLRNRPAPEGREPQQPAENFAAWDLLDVERYRALWLGSHGYFSLNMAASRGCSFRCTWCAKPIWGNQYLQRSAAEVASEMAYLKRAFDPQHIWFADDIFGLKVQWVAEFAAAAEASDARIPFTIQTRADLISDRMSAALRAAGCREAWIGAESGSQRVLDAMNKGTTVAQILTARRRLEAAGIRVGFFIQLGYLDEDLADIVATRDLLRVARPDEIGVSVAYPLPGTKFHDLVKEQLGRKTHWQQSDDLEMMFRGTFTSDFYRAVRDLLHAQITQQSSGGDTSRALESSWQDLLARAVLYRLPSRGVAATG